MSDHDALVNSSYTGIDDCWKRIGVQGDKSCPLLKEHIHCRNCPVFEAAAASLMNRSLPDSYQKEWAAQFGLAPLEESAATASAIVFRVGKEWLALPTATLIEVADSRAIHSIPHRREGAVLGLANIRGELVICLSLAKLVNASAMAAPALQTTATARARLLVVHYEGLQVGFPVAEVHGVERYDPAGIQPLPATLAKSANPFCRGRLSFGERGVGCLDPDLLFKSINRSLT